MTRLFGRTVTAFLVLVATMFIAASAGAAAPVTETTTVKDTDAFVDVLTSCGEDAPPLRDHDRLQRRRAHDTFDDGRAHATFTQSGKFVAEALEPDAPSVGSHDLASGRRSPRPRRQDPRCRNLKERLWLA